MIYRMMAACILAVALLTQVAYGEPQMLNRVLARVNDAIITQKDVQILLAPDLEFLQRQFATQPKLLEQKISELVQHYLENLIDKQLILHEFKTSGFNLPESYIEEQVDKDIRNTYGNRAMLTKTIQAQGMTYEAYRAKLRENVILSAMWQHHVPRDPVISPYKIELYYVENQAKYKVEDEVKLRMIVITNRPNESLISPKKMAEEILTKIKEGAPFNEMAQIYSQGSQSVEGGDWGWVERSVLRADLTEKAFALKPNEISDVIDAKDGCYIMKVEGSRPAHIKALPDVREEIESTLKDEASKRLRKKWIDRLRSKSFVVIYPLQ